MIHQFRNFVGERTSWAVELYGISDLAPSASVVKLQIYDYVAVGWVDVDDDSTTGADTYFSLSGSITVDAGNYKDASNVITCRVYQQAI
jgi:hypothetical protein